MNTNKDIIIINASSNIINTCHHRLFIIIVSASSTQSCQRHQHSHVSVINTVMSASSTQSCQRHQHSHVSVINTVMSASSTQSCQRHQHSHVSVINTVMSASSTQSCQRHQLSNQMLALTLCYHHQQMLSSSTDVIINKFNVIKTDVIINDVSINRCYHQPITLSVYVIFIRCHYMGCYHQYQISRDINYTKYHHLCVDAYKYTTNKVS